MFHLLLPIALVTPQGGDLSTLHPGDALVYFEMADVQQVYQAYQSSSYAQILRDPECQRAVEKLIPRLKEGDLENPGHFIHQMLNEVSDGQWSAIRGSLVDLATVSFSVSLHDMTPAQLFEGVTEENFFDDGPLGDRLERSLRMAMVVDFQRPETAAQAFQFIQQAGASTELEIKGEAATQVTIDGGWINNGPSGALLIGNRIAYVAGEDPKTYFTRQISQSQNPTSLQRFAESNKHFATLNAEGATYDKIFEFKSTLGEQIFPYMPYREFYVPVLDLISGALGADLDMLLRGGHWRVTMENIGGKGRFISQGYQPDLNLGPFDRVFTKHTIAAETLDNVHEDSVLAASMTLDKADFKALLAHLFEQVGEDPFAELKSKYNFSPEEDILQHLGPAWIASMPVSSIGVSSLPGLSVWMQLEDKRGLMNGLQKLQAVVAGTSDGSAELRVKDYRQHTMFTLMETGSRGGLSAMLRPTIIVFDDRVLVTPSSSQAKKEIRRLSGETPQVLHPHVNHETKPQGDIVEYSYADWGRIFARIYTGAKQLLPMLEVSMPDEVAAEIPVNLKALPEAELFTRYFDPTYRHRKRVDGGILIRVESSVGPEMAGLTSAGLAFGFFWMMPGEVYYEEELEAVPPPQQDF